MNGKQIKNTKIYSIIHAILTIAILIGSYAIFESVIFTCIIYALSLTILPTLAESLSFLGSSYEVDHLDLGDDFIIYGRFIEYYGVLDVLRDLIGAIGRIVLPAVPIVVFCPESIWMPFLMGATALLTFMYIIHPLFEDLVWIFAKKDKTEFLQKAFNVGFNTILIVGIVATVACGLISMKMARDRLDLNAILADYFAAEEQFDPYANIDLSDADVDFSKLSTNAKLVLKEKVLSQPGIAYQGSLIYLEYDFGKGIWNVTGHSFTGEPEIVSKLVYVGENELEIGGFSGTAQIEITVFSKGPEGGDGIFKIIDKETSAEVYCSPITFENYAGAWSNITIRFAKPLNLGPWEVDQEHIRWIDEDHIYFYMNTRDFDLYLQK